MSEFNSVSVGCIGYGRRGRKRSRNGRNDTYEARLKMVSWFLGGAIYSGIYCISRKVYETRLLSNIVYN